jgi:hypothetical protein
MTGAVPQRHALMLTPSTHPDTWMVDALAEAIAAAGRCATSPKR